MKKTRPAPPARVASSVTGTLLGKAGCENEDGRVRRRVQSRGYIGQILPLLGFGEKVRVGKGERALSWAGMK